MTGARDPDALLPGLRETVAKALAAAIGSPREERVRAIEEAIAGALAGQPAAKAGEALAALEAGYPVRRTPAEEECIALRRQLEEERALRASVEGKLRAIENRLQSGDTEAVRRGLEKLAGGKFPASADDPERLEAVLEVLSEHAAKTIGYGNVGLERWNFREDPFKPLEEMVSAHLPKPPREVAGGLRGELARLRDLIKAMIKADLQFTPKWCEGTQARLSPEAFSQGVSKAKAWEKFEGLMESYRFSDDLMQGLRTFIAGERQRAGG